MHDQLTARQREVLAYVARGLTDGEIARTLVISERTVNHHVAAILEKLGLETRTQAAVWALQHLVEPTDER